LRVFERKDLRGEEVDEGNRKQELKGVDNWRGQHGMCFCVWFSFQIGH